MKLGILGNIEKQNLPEVLSELINTLHRHKVDYIVEKAIAKKSGLKLKSSNTGTIKNIVTSCNIAASLGGDGTLLNTARLLKEHNIPIFGINMGKLGFMAEIAPQEMDNFISDLTNRKYRISERITIKAAVKNKTFYAINDIVIDRSASLRMLNFKVYFNKEFVVSFVADGTIISTQTGSTGYSLSAGGPIITPDSKVLILTPICAHTLNVRPIIFPEEGEIEIEITSESETRITADGQVSESVKAPLSIAISKGKNTVKIIKRFRSSYFKTLNKKLLWGEDKRKN